jgi:hypothetical protein
MDRARLSEAEIGELLEPGPPIQSAPWLRLEAVSAAASRDVMLRHGEAPDDRTRAERARDCRAVRLKAWATAQSNRSVLFYRRPDFSLTS